MPAQIVPYIRGILQGHKITATFLQHQFGFSHDCLTRVLKKQFVWQKLLMFTINRLFGVLKGGYLIIDDTVIAKPYAKSLEGASFVYSSILERTVYGYAVVLLCWTNGRLTIPLSWRWYKKGKASKVDLAQDLLGEAYNLWKLQPKLVVFDSWYAASRILNQLKSYGWQFVFQIKKNRVVSCAPIKEDLTQDGDSLVGMVTDQVKGTIIRHDEKFFCTNDLSLSSAEILSAYAYRWAIEEVFRFTKSQLHLQKCQARSQTAQETHLASCVLAYLLIQREKQDTTQTLYVIKRDWLLNRRLGNNRLNHYVKVLSA